MSGLSNPSAIVNALHYAQEKIKPKAPFCNFNEMIVPSGDIFSYKIEREQGELLYDYNTCFVAATRQMDETLGLIAKACQHTQAQGQIIIAQDNKYGAPSLEKHLKQGFSNISTLIKFKCRIWIVSPAHANPDILGLWHTKAAIQPVMDAQYMSAPGLFSWDRQDAGSVLLVQNLPNTLQGVGADLGCGYGFLSCALALQSDVKKLYSIDLDARAVACCAQNLSARAPKFEHVAMQADVTSLTLPEALDFIVMNPPFHTQMDEDRALGQRFCENALKLLKKRGVLYVVANRHLPYEAILQQQNSFEVLAQSSVFKVLRVIK